MNGLNKFALVDIGHANHISVDSLMKINISADTFCFTVLYKTGILYKFKACRINLF